MNKVFGKGLLYPCRVSRQLVRSLWPLAVTSVLVVVCGCAPMNIRVAHVPSAHFPATGSYAWVPNMDPPGPTGIDVHQLDVDFISLDTRVQRAVDSELAAKGYKLGGPQTPNFLITYRVASKQRSTWGLGPDLIWVYGGDGLRLQQDSLEYTEGTLILNIMDPKTRRVLWHASAESNIDVSVSTDEKDARIGQAVRRMLQQFPPKAR
jgi:hypothetical protein